MFIYFVTRISYSLILCYIIASSTNKSPKLRLIQEIYEDMIRRSNDNKVSIEAIQGNIKNEISSMRNFTHQMTENRRGRDFLLLDIFDD